MSAPQVTASGVGKAAAPAGASVGARAGRREDDETSELGGVFTSANPASVFSSSLPAQQPRAGQGGQGVAGVVRAGPVSAMAYGRGPVPPDPRKFAYDRVRAKALPAIQFGASKADRLDPEEAGNILNRIHEMFGLSREGEDVIAAFDKALFFEHTINGASMLQAGRGCLTVGESAYDLTMVKSVLGVDQRRFFRAYADEVADVNREVVNSHDPYDPYSAQKFGQLMQVATARGLHKFPHLAHDSSDAGLCLSLEERIAVGASKRLVIPSTENNVDKLLPRVGSANADD